VQRYSDTSRVQRAQTVASAGISDRQWGHFRCGTAEIDDNRINGPKKTAKGISSSDLAHVLDGLSGTLAAKRRIPSTPLPIHRNASMYMSRPPILLQPHFVVPVTVKHRAADG
jgi:hypothetical protein